MIFRDRDNEDFIFDRIFTELDLSSKSLVELSKIVHSNAAILGIVVKIVIGIILFLCVTSTGVLYTYVKDENQKPAPIERPVAPKENQKGGAK